MESFAPKTYAESWDNVGILTEPSSPTDIKKILLTNDLTENVLNEALKHEINLIISYHPPIFSGLKRLTQGHWKERIIVKCIENRIAVYSPHTSWDACNGGVNDWLANSLSISSKTIAIPSSINPEFGAGRICQVDGSLTLKQAIEEIKSYTGLANVQVAVASQSSLDSQIKSFGVCAGSGASVLKAIKVPIDLFITGELSHHEALEAAHQQTNIIALNHSNSERGFLKEFKKILGNLLNEKVEIIVSETDEDPLKTY
jgi:dinuclear metal center YbgI/SA1388 family protein